ncbi:MAG TPA: adenylate/guanylate cyclase domain-containing protein [Blastocatellia bacterium]|nr:adenylate/guanylate cyclase domain-containing protein [Blastocatellia bacterium]
MPPKLRISNQITGQKSEFELGLDEIRIGRAAGRNDVVLNDERVSRQHATIRRSDNAFVLNDLESANGTFVNGLRINERLLSNHDTISIGNFALVYEEQETLPSFSFDNVQIGAVVLRDPERITQSSPQDKVSPDSPNEPSLGEEVVTLRKKAETLSRLYELSRVLSSVFSLKDIFKKVSEMIFRTTRADRFVVLLKTAAPGQLAPFATEFRNPTSSLHAETISISQTVLDRVVSERVALLSYDAQTDDRLKQSHSIVMQHVRSVMCAPLLGKEGVLGAIYVDSQRLMQVFTPDDLDMLNAIAAQTSMAVDNAMTHDQLVKEALARAAYGRFMPRHVVEQILASPEALSLGGVNQTVTVLFSDIRGFTTISESLPPETVVRILNEFFSDMTPIVFGHRGLLDKYIGDAVMAIFGAPYATDDSAISAVAAAVAMQRKMLLLNEELKEDGLPQLGMGIGINTGTVTVGYIGSEQRTDYTVIGDTVNAASRLEGEAKAWQILISGPTLEAIGDAFRVNAVGEMPLKGKTLPVQVYEVLWRPEDQPVPSTRA